jgi:hypothetical protein
MPDQCIDLSKLVVLVYRRSVVDKSIKGGPTTEHEGEENFNMHLVHGTDNEAEMDVEFARSMY